MMNRSESREIGEQFQTLSPFILRMIVAHPNMCAEIAANELIVRRIREAHTIHPGHSVKV